MAYELFALFETQVLNQVSGNLTLAFPDKFRRINNLAIQKRPDTPHA
jgi:hypothetical protein